MNSSVNQCKKIYNSNLYFNQRTLIKKGLWEIFLISVFRYEGIKQFICDLDDVYKKNY